MKWHNITECPPMADSTFSVDVLLFGYIKCGTGNEPTFVTGCAMKHAYRGLIWHVPLDHNEEFKPLMWAILDPPCKIP